jgi:hypothetical protein
MTTLTANRPAGAPPAILAAYLRQGRWKTWALAAQFAVNLFLIVCVYAAVKKEPDVVLVSPDGASSYLNRPLAGDALLRFLAEQRQLPSETTIVHFSKTFLDLVLAVNSSTVEATWPQGLALMSPELRERVGKQAAAEKLIEGYQLALTKTSLAYPQLTLLEHTDSLVHLRALVDRTRSSLLGPDRGGSRLDRVAVDLVERIVPRTPTHPDGLLVSDWRIEVLPENTRITDNGPQPETQHAP